MDKNTSETKFDKIAITGLKSKEFWWKGIMKDSKILKEAMSNYLFPINIFLST